MTDQPAPALTPSERRQTLAWLAHRRKYSRLYYFTPYPKQAEFLAFGKLKRERLLMAANRIGKTATGAFEAACHATGQYPHWWKGRRFEGPTRGWVVGETAQATRDICQTQLCGEPGVTEMLGTGMLPKDTILDTSLGRSYSYALDTVQVRHKSGGVSIIRFKSTEQGRAKFQGEALDWCWFDEEPPIVIYAEGMARIGERDGICWVTFTPIQGPTAVVLRYTDEPSNDRVWVQMTLDDVPPDGHLSAETKAKMEAGYMPHEREARARGVPALGEGRIFMTPEAMIIEPPLEYIPAHWHKIWGIDFGIGHPFAAVLAIWDKDNDVVHVHEVVRMSDALTMAHAAAIKRIGDGIPVAWPRDGTERDRNTGEPLANSYRKLGVRMLHEHAQWEDGSVSTWAGIKEWDEREKTGRLRVAAQLTMWFEERRFYHLKEGKIVKIKDDIMSATRICLMAKRFARAMPLGGRYDPKAGGTGLAANVDFDVFAPSV